MSSISSKIHLICLLQKHSDAKLELEQMLLVVDEADKPEIQENISFYDANLSGLTQELQQLKREGLFTVSVCDKDCDIASKWGSLISMVLFTLSYSKLQRKKFRTQTQLLTVNKP